MRWLCLRQMLCLTNSKGGRHSPCKLTGSKAMADKPAEEVMGWGEVFGLWFALVVVTLFSALGDPLGGLRTWWSRNRPRL